MDNEPSLTLKISTPSPLRVGGKQEKHNVSFIYKCAKTLEEALRKV